MRLGAWEDGEVGGSGGSEILKDWVRERCVGMEGVSLEEAVSGCRWAYGNKGFWNGN